MEILGIQRHLDELPGPCAVNPLYDLQGTVAGQQRHDRPADEIPCEPFDLRIVTPLSQLEDRQPGSFLRFAKALQRSDRGRELCLYLGPGLRKFAAQFRQVRDIDAYQDDR